MLNRDRTAWWLSSICLLIALSLPGFATAADAEAEVSSAVDLKLWGRAVFNMQYDTGLQKARDFMSYLEDDKTEAFSFNPRDTRFGFKASSGKGNWLYSGVFEMDFYGANAGNSILPRMRLGYAEAKNSNGLSIRGGQDWIPVAQQNPGTIDFGVQSWSGNLWWRVPQFTLRYKPNKIEFLVSAMKHRVSNDTEAQEKMPWVLGRVGFSDLLGEGSLIALGGGFRSESDLTFTREGAAPITSSTADYSSYLVALELKFPFAKGWEIKGEVYTGEGVGPGFVHYGFDYNPWHPDGARSIQSQGGFVSLKIPAGEKIHFNAGFGLDDPRDEDLSFTDPDDATMVEMGGPYFSNQTIFANMKYSVTKQFGWGLEVIDFTTKVAQDDGTTDLTGQRFTGSWWYIF